MNRGPLTTLLRLALTCLVGLGMMCMLSWRDAETSAHVEAISSRAEAAAPASLQSGNTFLVTRTDDPPPDGCQPGDCSLREAIIAANDVSDPRFDPTIGVPAGIYTLTISGAEEDACAKGDLDITRSVTIFGAGADSRSSRPGPRRPCRPASALTALTASFISSVAARLF